MIARPRPFDVIGGIELLIQAPTDFSFPSGHTSAAFAAAVVMLMNRSNMKYCLLGFAVVMGFSRIYLHVHYLTDVIGGVAVGVAAGIVAVECYQLYQSYKKRRARRRQSRLES